jgi:hypothetical protein
MFGLLIEKNQSPGVSTPWGAFSLVFREKSRNVMKLLKSIYIDSKDNVWIIQKESLPKRKGTYNYWIGECISLNIAYKESKKKDLKTLIENRILKY